MHYQSLISPAQCPILQLIGYLLVLDVEDYVKKFAFAGIMLGLLVAALILSGCGSGPREPGRYYADDEDYSIKFPEGWTIEIGEDGAAVSAISPLEDEYDVTFELVNVVVDDMIFEVDLEEYFNAVNRSARTDLPYFELELAEDATICGVPAKKAIFTFVDEGEVVKTMGYMVIKGSKAYMITCMAEEYSFPSYAAEFETSVQSFRFE